MTSFRKSYTFIAFLLLHSFKKNILCFINAFKHRGPQNELFMNIQMRLLPFNIKEKMAQPLVICCQEIKTFFFLFRSVLRLGDMLFLDFFSLWSFCSTSRQDNMRTRGMVSQCYCVFSRVTGESRSVVSVWLCHLNKIFLVFHGRCQWPGSSALHPLKGFMKLHRFPHLILPLPLISHEYYPAA